MRGDGSTRLGALGAGQSRRARFRLRLLLALTLLGAALPFYGASAQESGCPRATVDESQVVAVPPIPVRVDGPAGVVALTFDAGADRGYAEDILDELLQEGIPASFGMTGVWAKANPDLVERMAADGQLVINHTLDHRSFTGLSDRLGGLSRARRQAELQDADAIIAPLVGHTTCPWYRLPYGDGDARVAADVAPLGYSQQVGWTVDSLGWRGVPMQAIVERCLRLAAPNAVYVMHVGSTSRDGPALPAIVAGLRAQGYGFATVAALY
jgi:peptidoglycan/xylan/chitin deacetylase (PgdA/CDA1 family)